MRPCEYGSRKDNKRKVTALNMVIFLIYSMSKWISIYSELSPSIGILPTAASLLGK
ncbi:hypothetical protein Gohar_024978 [Gossypium harknessii]|uniref:Uncharacterized protein n=1 Tax=Gossypium harknessii TaxID=34285 RepID=A0A7J9HHR1_9ROSI|nr:hypothetical protein [Gossypium harknessii]